MTQDRTEREKALKATLGSLQEQERKPSHATLSGYALDAAKSARELLKIHEDQERIVGELGIIRHAEDELRLLEEKKHLFVEARGA